MYQDFYTDTGKFYILSRGLITPLAPRFRTIACFTARCISDSSKYHLPYSPVWIFFHLFFCEKSHCHLNSLLPPWYLSERAWGSFTKPKPAFKSSSWIFRKFYIWDFNSQMSVRGIIIWRSLSPFPWRTIISFLSKSKSKILSDNASFNLSPVP